MLTPIAIVFFLHLTADNGVLGESRTNFDVKRLVACATDGPVEYSFNITKHNDEQYLDAYMKSPIPLDGNIGMNIIIESSLDGHIFLPLFTIREKDFCKAMNKYLGELWYDVQRAAQIPCGVCPIQAGTYRVHHLLMNFYKITLQTFPFGTLRFTIRGIDKRGNKIVFCEIMEVNNLQQ